MSQQAVRSATVFGGSGFLGRRIVERLAADGIAVRVAARHAERITSQRPGESIEPVRADVHDDAAVAAAVDGVEAVVNAVGLYVEGGGATFRSVHVEGAGRVAAAARRAGVERLVHISGLGAEPGARSPYVRARGAGEEAVRRAFENAAVFRPSVMFGPDDAFLTTLAMLTRWLPALPLFGRGRTRLQPVFVGDVAEAVARAATAPDSSGGVYELGGPEVYTYRELLALVSRTLGHRRLLIPVPFAVWDALAIAAQALPAPPLTEGQVALMKRDNVAAPDLPGLADLGVRPTTLSAVLADLLAPSAP